MEFDVEPGDERLYDVDAGDRPHDAADALIESSLQAVPEGPPPYLSPSSASTFRSCPRRWKFRYIDRLPDPAGEPALAGTFAHRVLELLCQLPSQERTLERARELARDAWPELAADPDFEALELDDDAQRRFRWLAWTAIEGLWYLEDPATIDVEATEQKIDAVLGDVPFRGVVDRIDLVAADGSEAELVVTDYKSGRAPSARFADAKLEQVVLYAAAIEASVGRRPTAARLLYLGQSIIETPITDDLIDGAVEALTATWEQVAACIDSDEFGPSTGPLCGWCPYADQCPEGLAELRYRQASGRIRATAPSLRFLESAAPQAVTA